MWAKAADALAAVETEEAMAWRRAGGAKRRTACGGRGPGAGGSQGKEEGSGDWGWCGACVWGVSCACGRRGATG